MKYAFWVLLILTVIFRFFTTKPVYRNGDTIRITARIYSDPLIYATSQYLKISGLKVYLPKIPEIYYGDRIVVEGVVDGDKLQDPKLVSVEGTKNFLTNFRNRVIFFYQKVLPEPFAGLTAGITLGSKGALTSDFWEKVKKTGVAHVVVASGTNVTFVTSFLIGFLSLFLPRRRMIFFAILGIVLYLFVAGFEAPLIRAALMSGALFLAQETGRLVSSWRLLFLTGLGMLIVRPDWINDIGFILSFVSTASLMLFSGKIEAKLKFLPGFFREGLSTSFAAQIGVAPILFVTFGQFNIWSPFINALVLWTIPFIMIFGAAGGVVGIIFEPLGRLILWLGYPFAWWFVKVVYLA